MPKVFRIRQATSGRVRVQTLWSWGLLNAVTDVSIALCHVVKDNFSYFDLCTYSDLINNPVEYLFLFSRYGSWDLRELRVPGPNL